MDEPTKKRPRMNTGGVSVNRNNGKPKTDDAKIESAAVPEFFVSCGIDHSKYGIKNKPGNLHNIPKKSDVSRLKGQPICGACIT